MENNFNVGQYFNKLKDKEIIGVHFIQDYFEIIFDRGYIRITSECFIKSGDKNLALPSEAAVWRLVNLMNKCVQEITADEYYYVIKIDNGDEIWVNSRISPAGENLQLRVEEFTPVFL